MDCIYSEGHPIGLLTILHNYNFGFFVEEVTFFVKVRYVSSSNGVQQLNKDIKLHILVEIYAHATNRNRLFMIYCTINFVIKMLRLSLYVIESAIKFQLSGRTY